MKIVKMLLFLPVLLFSFPPPAFTQEMQKMTLGCPTVILSASVLVAEDKGYFKEEGLDVAFKEFASGKAALESMLDEGGLDMVLVAETPIMMKSFQRTDFAILASIVNADNDVKVCARRDRGIGTFSDLKGKKIGVTYGTIGHFFLYLSLLYNGIQISEVEAVDFKAFELVGALTEGSVDAISAWEPNILIAAKRLKDNAIVLESPGIYQEGLYVASKKDFLVNNPEIAKKFLRAVIKATDFIHSNKDQSLAIVARRLKIEREQAALVWQAFDFEVMLDQTILLTLEDEARWAMKEQMVTGSDAPNYLKMIYFDAMEAVAPQKVSIVRKE